MFFLANKMIPLSFEMWEEDKTTLNIHINGLLF